MLSPVAKVESEANTEAAAMTETKTDTEAQVQIGRYSESQRANLSSAPLTLPVIPVIPVIGKI